MTLKHGSLFTGVGMLDYGLEMSLEIKTIFQVENNPYCRAVLDRRFPDVTKYGDIKQCTGEELRQHGHIDILSGGFPCTDISVAGRRKVEDEKWEGGKKVSDATWEEGLGIGTREDPSSRSGLWYEFHRLITEVKPSWVIVENVARLCHTEDGSTVVSDLAEAGYAWGATLLATEVLGSPHPRPRVWIVACNDYPLGDGDTGDGVGPLCLPDNQERAFAQASENGCYWKRQLGTGTPRPDGNPEQSESAAYSEGVRRVHDDARWVDRLRCCGNSVIWVIPACIGAFIVQVERGRKDRGGSISD